MLPPTLDALAYLHGKKLVQGQLKPPNVLVVNDQLKLASDTIRPADASAASIAQSSVYDSPEAIDGRIFAAGDIWALGVTVVEALTQRPPAWPDEGSKAVSLPGTLPPAFADTVRRCLSRDPSIRPTIADLDAQFKPPPPASAVALSPKRRVFAPSIAVALILFAAVWAGSRLFQSRPSSGQPASSTSEVPSRQAASSAAASQDLMTPKPALTPAFVLHPEIPHVPRSARESIRGHIKVTVRVTIDRSGNVVAETLEYPGSSRYFARLAAQAARKWKFAPVDSQEPRVRRLLFEFTRGDTTGQVDNSRTY